MSSECQDPEAGAGLSFPARGSGVRVSLHVVRTARNRKRPLETSIITIKGFSQQAGQMAKASELPLALRTAGFVQQGRRHLGV